MLTTGTAARIWTMLAACAAAASAYADPVADFYKGRTVAIIVTSQPGGGYDVLSRLIAKALPHHLPGSPSVVVQNMAGAGGIVGTNAARMAAGVGAEVTILDRSLPRLRELDQLFAGRVRTRYSTGDAVAQEIAAADVVIGAVLVPGALAPKLVRRAQLSTMKKGAVIVDVAIDQGDCFETSRPTTHADPTFVVDGVIHYCVANMPGAVPLTSSYALNNATLPFGLMLAARGLSAIRENPHLRAGLNVHRGQVTHPAVAASLGLPLVEASAALAA